MKFFFKFAEICWLHFYREAMLPPRPCTLRPWVEDKALPARKADNLVTIF
jgi:hypothetical protein